MWVRERDQLKTTTGHVYTSETNSVVSAGKGKNRQTDGKKFPERQTRRSRHENKYRSRGVMKEGIRYKGRRGRLHVVRLHSAGVVSGWAVPWIELNDPEIISRRLPVRSYLSLLDAHLWADSRNECNYAILTVDDKKNTRIISSYYYDALTKSICQEDRVAYVRCPISLSVKNALVIHRLHNSCFGTGRILTVWQ